MPKGFSLGFDLGGTQVRAALVKEGEIVRRAALRTDVSGGPEAVMAQFQRLASEVMDGAAIGAVGISAPGPLDTVAGIVDHIPTLPGWEQFPLRARMAEQFSVPAIVENDGISAAYGEWKFGAGVGLSNFVYATISTGIGGGVVMDDNLLHGRRGMGAHIGHFRMDPNGPICSCGGTGCFEALAAGSALDKRTAEAAAADPGSYLGKIAAVETVTAGHAVRGAKVGDATCLDLLQQEARFLGLGFTGLAHMFSPERIIMGGGVSKAFDLLQDEIHATIRREAMPPFRNVRVVAAKLGDNAGLIGAASLAMDRP